jgi:hypothetical protein
MCFVWMTRQKEDLSVSFEFCLEEKQLRLTGEAIGSLMNSSLSTVTAGRIFVSSAQLRFLTNP